MTPEQTALVRNSWQHLLQDPDQVTRLFRQALRETDPSLAALAAASQSPLDHIDPLVAHINKPGMLRPALRRLILQMQTRIRADQACALGQAIFKTLQQALGARWTVQTEGAWLAAYATASRVLLGLLAERAAANCPNPDTTPNPTPLAA